MCWSRPSGPELIISDIMYDNIIIIMIIYIIIIIIIIHIYIYILPFSSLLLSFFALSADR